MRPTALPLVLALAFTLASVVLGPIAGLFASIQCLETLRLLIGAPPQLAGRLLRFSGLTMEFRTLQIERNPQCPVCGSSQRRSTP